MYNAIHLNLVSQISSCVVIEYIIADLRVPMYFKCFTKIIKDKLQYYHTFINTKYIQL